MTNAQSNKPHPRDRESLLAIDHETLVDMYLALEAQKEQVCESLREYITQKYGKKNERFETPGQLLVFPGGTADGATPESQAAPGVSENSTAPVKKPKKPGHGRKPIPAHLTRVPVDAKPPSEEDRRCPACDALRVADRKILRNSRYGCVPASFFVE